MSERQSGRPAPWPDRDPRDTRIADQRPEEAPAEQTGERPEQPPERPSRDREEPERGA